MKNKKPSYSDQLILDLGLTPDNCPALNRTADQLNNEIWLVIPTSEQYGDLSNYSVSTLGRVKNTITNKFLSQSINMVGYWQVLLRDSNHKLHGPSTHTLEMLAWTGYSCKDLTPHAVVDHVNGNKLDNRIENLRYLTPKLNSQLAVRNGLWRNQTIIKCVDDNTIFHSIREATEHYGFYRTALSSQLRYQDTCVYQNKHFVILNVLSEE